MLVDVVCLRLKGEPCEPEDVKAEPRKRGYLHLRPVTAQPDGPGPATRSYLAKLTHADDPLGVNLLPPLTDAKVTKIKGRNIAVSGIERVADVTLPTLQPQTWWCRVVER